METFIAVCLGLITLELSVITVFVVLTLIRVGRAARAVEVLVYRVDGGFEAIGSAMRSGWVRTVGALANIAGPLWSFIKR